MPPNKNHRQGGKPQIARFQIASSLFEGNQLARQENLARGAGDADTQAYKEQAEKNKTQQRDRRDTPTR